MTARLKAESALREQEALQAANDRFREMDRLKTQFINNAAHELATPLTPIKLQAHMLDSEKLGPLSDRQRSSVKVLARNFDQLGLLLRDVLDSARVQAERLDVRARPTDVLALAKEAAESFHEGAVEAGVTLAVGGESVVVEADPARLTQVLFNLVRNALKFTPRGGHVRIAVRRDGAGARVSVTDTGSGIRPEDIEKLFQPFSQVHDKMEKTRSGTGLGLYIAKGIIEAHGGEIGCESEGLGRGAEFTFTVPAVPARRLPDVESVGLQAN
ncbi:MAG: sensor histidine kinase [Thermoplasmatota archaeon]